MPIRLVNDAEEKVDWNPQPYAYYWQIDLKKIDEQLSAELLLKPANFNNVITLAAMVAKHNSVMYDKVRLLPKLYIINGVRIVPMPTYLTIIWSFGQDDINYFYSQIFKDLRAAAYRYERRWYSLLLEQLGKQKAKINFGGQKKFNPFS
jgi:hypothetical protein